MSTNRNTTCKLIDCLESNTVFISFGRRCITFSWWKFMRLICENTEKCMWDLGFISMLHNSKGFILSRLYDSP